MALLPIVGVSLLFGLLGLRLLRSGLRSVGAHEQWLGLFFLAVGIAQPLRVAVAMGVDVGFDPGALNLLGHAAFSVGVACFAVFLQRVFHPQSAAGRRGLAALLALVAAQFAVWVAFGAYRHQGSPVHLVAVVAMIAIFGWAFFEAFGYWRQLRRRAALGMADRVITNRFGLWCLWTGSLAVLPLAIFAIRVFALLTQVEAEPTSVTVGERFRWALTLMRAVVMVVGPVTCASLWLSFFPPERYLARLRAPAA